MGFSRWLSWKGQVIWFAFAFKSPLLVDDDVVEIFGEANRGSFVVHPRSPTFGKAGRDSFVEDPRSPTFGKVGRDSFVEGPRSPTFGMASREYFVEDPWSPTFGKAGRDSFVEGARSPTFEKAGRDSFVEGPRSPTFGKAGRDYFVEDPRSTVADLRKGRSGYFVEDPRSPTFGKAGRDCFVEDPRSPTFGKAGRDSFVDDPKAGRDSFWRGVGRAGRTKGGAERWGTGRSEVVGALMGFDGDITEGPPGGFQKGIEKTNRSDGRRQVQRVDSVSGSNTETFTETFGAHRGAELVFPIDVNTTFRPQPLGLNYPALRPPLFGPSAPTIRPISLNCSAHRPQPSGPLASIARPFGLNHLALQAIVNLQIKNPGRPFRRSATVDLQQNIPASLSEGRRPWIFNKISRPAFPKVGDRGSSTKESWPAFPKVGYRGSSTKESRSAFPKVGNRGS
ncbi:hypothetical protein V8G54_024192 [Vigna mungo]|uniref:Uncharacterized protein n=1 Tax=Vigna mungo TaxID=3915 RepID=A0AAQ3N6B3_VIGMU